MHTYATNNYINGYDVGCFSGMIVHEVTLMMNAAPISRVQPQSSSNETNTTATVTDGAEQVQVPAKRARSSLFASYERRRQEGQPTESAATTLSISAVTVATSFIERMVCIASSRAGAGPEAWDVAKASEHYNIMRLLLEKIFSVPATSAPVERVFSHGGIIMKPNRAQLSDEMLSALVFMKCNSTS